MRFSSRPVALLGLASLALLAAGCSAFNDEGSAPGSDGQVEIAAAFYPLAWVAERVSEGTETEVDLLTRPGSEPHDLELGVQETALVTQADLVLFQSGFQPAVEDAVEQNAQGEVLDVVDVVDLIAIEESPDEHDEHGHDEHGHDEHGHDEHGHEGEGEGEHADHDHGDSDPHFWLDPLRMAELAEAVAAELGDLDADNADAYRANAAELRADLEATDQGFVTGLGACERDTIVVSHDAFGYLEKYGLHVASIVGLSPDAEPTGAVLGELQELIRTEGITTVFSEPLKPALGENLARDLDLAGGVLDPIEGLTEDTADEDYLSLMAANLDAIADANGCR